MSSKSVTHWIQQLHGGDERATQEIWSRYFEKLVRLARKHLHPLPRRAFDEQDVALSAFNSFFQGVSQGRFPQLNDRHDLWKLLVTITLERRPLNTVASAGRSEAAAWCAASRHCSGRGIWPLTPGSIKS